MSVPPASTPFELLFADHDAEMARSRRLLALVPDGRNDWTPHQKSMTLGRLATHLAELPEFLIIMCTTSELDFASGRWKPAVAGTTAERLALFDRLTAEMTTAMRTLDWPAATGSWVMRMGDHVLSTANRASHLRTMYSHMTHHRAQLGVYLRMLGVAIPGTYGPSADEM